MVAALWLGMSVLLATDGTALDSAADHKPATPATAPDLKAYEAARDALGRGSDAHVKLALWCEAHGLSAERVKHLALAVLTAIASNTASVTATSTAPTRELRLIPRRYITTSGSSRGERRC